MLTTPDTDKLATSGNATSAPITGLKELAVAKLQEKHVGKGQLSNYWPNELVRNMGWAKGKWLVIIGHQEKRQGLLVRLATPEQVARLKRKKRSLETKHQRRNPGTQCGNCHRWNSTENKYCIRCGYTMPTRQEPPS